MSETDVDQRLERLFQAALGLTQEREEALLQQFEARRQEDRYVWAAFAAVMLGLGARLHSIVDFRLWIVNCAAATQTGTPAEQAVVQSKTQNPKSKLAWERLS